MIKKFYQFITEAERNIFQKGTPFSNGHRSRKNGFGFLLDRHLMIDLDKIIIDSSGNIVALIEKKNQLPGPGSAFQNILDPSVKSPQKLALLELSKKLNCKLFVYVNSTEEYHLLRQDFTTKTYSSEIMESTILKNKFKIVDTDNLIFIEFRLNYGSVQLKAIVERLSGSNTIMIGYTNQISEKCGSIPIIQVDDERPQIIFKSKGQIVGKVDSVLYPANVFGAERTRIENTWEDIYRQLGIFD